MDDCTSLIESSVALDESGTNTDTESLPSLLDQCYAITRQPPEPEPIRIIHHFACTGGTLIAKCLSAMPNVQLLSEVAPFSQLIGSKAKFAPTDMIQLLRASSRGSSQDLEAELFRSQLNVVYQDCIKRGLRLILREHSHSTYCLGEEISNTPSIRDLAKLDHPLKCIVTIRHPLDSYLSLLSNGWLHFKPATLEEYSRRYMAFLDDHQGTKFFRYEDIVRRPKETLQKICVALEMPFREDFSKFFGAVRLSGDSGRSSSEISQRSRRLVPDYVREELNSEQFMALCTRIDYSV